MASAGRRAFIGVVKRQNETRQAELTEQMQAQAAKHAQELDHVRQDVTSRMDEMRQKFQQALDFQEGALRQVERAYRHARVKSIVSGGLRWGGRAPGGGRPPSAARARARPLSGPPGPGGFLEPLALSRPVRAVWPRPAQGSLKKRLGASRRALSPQVADHVGAVFSRLPMLGGPDDGSALVRMLKDKPVPAVWRKRPDAGQNGLVSRSEAWLVPGSLCFIHDICGDKIQVVWAHPPRHEQLQGTLTAKGVVQLGGVPVWKKGFFASLTYDTNCGRGDDAESRASRKEPDVEWISTANFCVAARDEPGAKRLRGL